MNGKNRIAKRVRRNDCLTLSVALKDK